MPNSDFPIGSKLSARIKSADEPWHGRGGKYDADDLGNAEIEHFRPIEAGVC